MDSLLCDLESSAYFDWWLIAMKAVLGRQVFRLLASGERVDPFGLRRQMRYVFNSCLRKICRG
jgi:hypothetical protein